MTIPDSVTKIGYDAFKDCYSLYTEYEFCNYVGSDDNPYAVLVEVTNKNMSGYTIHEDTKHIAPYVFENCSRLSSITIPDSVITIGDRAFGACKNLTSVTIGNGVKRICNYAFYDCTSLTIINFEGTVEQWNAIDFSDKWNSGVPTIEVICSDGTVTL